MSIVNEVQELQSLNEEIKRVRARLRKLNDTKSKIENSILNYLDDNNQPGLRYNGKTIIAERKNKRAYKKKAEKYGDAERVIRQHGISDSKGVLEDILEAMRGDAVEKNVVKMF